MCTQGVDVLKTGWVHSWSNPTLPMVMLLVASNLAKDGQAPTLHANPLWFSMTFRMGLLCNHSQDLDSSSGTKAPPGPDSVSPEPCSESDSPHPAPCLVEICMASQILAFF